MKYWLAFAAIGIVVVGAVIVGAEFGSAASPSSTAALTFSNGDEFVPTNVSAAMSSQDAIAAFKEADSEYSPPSDATVQLGLLTTGPEDGSYGVYQRAAYLILGGPCIRTSVLIGSSPQPMPDGCQMALFLDANTGEMLEGRNYVAVG